MENEDELKDISFEDLEEFDSGNLTEINKIWSRKDIYEEIKNIELANQEILSWLTNKERLKIIQDVAKNNNIDTTSEKHHIFSEVVDSIISKSIPLLCLLYKLYPLHLSLKEIYDMYSSLFRGWNAIHKEVFSLESLNKLEKFGLIKKKRLFELYPELENEGNKNIYMFSLSSSGVVYVRKFIKESFDLPVFKDDLFPKLLCMDAENLDDLRFINKIVGNHKELIAGYLYAKKSKYKEIFDSDFYKINPEVFAHKIEYNYLKNYYLMLEEYQRNIIGYSSMLLKKNNINNLNTRTNISNIKIEKNIPVYKKNEILNGVKDYLKYEKTNIINGRIKRILSLTEKRNSKSCKHKCPICTRYNKEK